MVFVEIFRLLLVITGTVAGLEIGKDISSASPTPVVGMVLGAMVSYVIGGVLGRIMDKKMDVLVRHLRDVPAVEVFSAAVVGTTGLLLGLVAGLPFAALVRSPVDLPAVAAFAWILAIAGARVGISKANQLSSHLNHMKPARQFSPSTDISPTALLVDTSALMDRPVIAAYRTGLITDTLAVPQFVLDELHALAEAEAPDPASARRARRALELLDTLNNEGNELMIIPDEVPEFDSVALKVSALAERYRLRVASSSKETASAVQAQGGQIVDLRSVVSEMSPTHLAGEHLRIDLVRSGTQPLQAVGYLPDGDMVVVNNASHRIGEKDVDVVVQTSRSTSQGLLIFARLAEPGD
jgi:uncharacterized protein YacL